MLGATVPCGTPNIDVAHSRNGCWNWVRRLRASSPRQTSLVGILLDISCSRYLDISCLAFLQYQAAFSFSKSDNASTILTGHFKLWGLPLFSRVETIYGTFPFCTMISIPQITCIYLSILPFAIFLFDPVGLFLFVFAFCISCLVFLGLFYFLFDKFIFYRLRPSHCFRILFSALTFVCGDQTNRRRLRHRYRWNRCGGRFISCRNRTPFSGRYGWLLRLISLPRSRQDA